MDSLVKSKRDLIELKNGFFKYSLAETFIPGEALLGGAHDCKFVFTLPPLNEMGFSDKYNQCLIKFNHIHISGRIAVNANGNYGENAEWYKSDGTSKQGGHGLLLVSDIPCRNDFLTGSVEVGSAPPIMIRTRQKLHQFITGVPKSGVLLRNANVDGIDVRGMKYYLKNGTIGLGGTQIADSTAPGNVSDGGVAGMNSVNIYNYENHNDIWTDGVLCGIPFGSQITFRIEDPIFNLPLCLTSAPSHIDGGGTTLELEMVVQLLPNP